MPLLYFVESEYPSDQHTAFNLLPVQFARRASALELAALLPSAQFDLTAGWVRARHVLGFAPIVNFYSEGDIQTILKTDGIELGSKIFLAQNDSSIRLIEGCSTRNGPSIVVTGNRRMVDHFASSEIVTTVFHTGNESSRQVYIDCYRSLVKMLARQKSVTFDGQLVADNFLDGYCLKKLFTTPTNLTANLLCRANEIVQAQSRGKIPEIWKDESSVLDTDVAYIRNVDIMREILAEKLVDTLLDARSAEGKLAVQAVSQSLREQVEDLRQRFSAVSGETARDEYLALRDRACKFREIYRDSEVTLAIPTVNPSCRSRAIQVLAEEHGIVDTAELEDLLEQVLAGGRRIIFRQSSEPLTRLAEELGNTRLSENEFLTNLTGLLASRKLSPVLRSATAASSLFNDLQKLQEYMGLGYLAERDNLEWWSTFGEQFRSVQARLTSHIPSPYLEAIRTDTPGRLTIVSDLPFELAEFEDSIALGQVLPTTRLPITPLRSLFHHYNRLAQRHHVDVAMKSLDRVLILNSLHKDDGLHTEFEVFKSTSVQVGLNFIDRTVLSSEDFVQALRSADQQILVYFGHGSYNAATDEGELIFRDDVLSYGSLPILPRIPPIIFLVGCETGSCSAFIGGLPANLLERGSMAILASLFPIPADHAAAFLGRTLWFAKEFITSERMVRLSDLIFGARKLGWLKDNVDALEKRGLISSNEALGIMKDFSDRAEAASLKRGISIPIRETIPILEDVLDVHGVLQTWREVRNTVTPFSLFFTLLGSAHDVFVGGGEDSP